MVGYTYLPGTNKCIPCLGDCLDCIAGNPYLCISCKHKPNQNYLFIKNKCYYCNINAIMDQNNGSCSCSNSILYSYIDHLYGC